MTDLISREAVLELVDKGYLISNGNYEKVRKRIESIPPARLELSDEEMQLFKKLRSFHSGSYAKLLDRIMAKASAQPEPQWIPCSERLPEKKTEVIYCLDNYFVSIGYMTDRDYCGDETELHWEDLESGALIYPEAWMPLPEPWKGEADVGDKQNNNRI